MSKVVTRRQESTDIEFRTYGGERMACLKGSIRIWKIIDVAGHYGMDPQKTA